MRPYCGALDKLQSDKARLFDVTLSFGYLMQFWEEYSDRIFAEGMISRLQVRWYSWEQPLLLFSLILHPKYRMTKFNSLMETINYVTFGHWLNYYYKAWIQKNPTKILGEFEKYRTKQYPFDEVTYTQFQDNILAY